MYSQKWCKTYLHLRVQVKSQKLYRQNSYSDYQEFLYKKCLDLKREGYGYRRISQILNEDGYKSVRGKVFKNGHIQSILNKGFIREKRLKSLKDYKIKYLDSRIEFVEI